MGQGAAEQRSRGRLAAASEARLAGTGFGRELAGLTEVKAVDGVVPPGTCSLSLSLSVEQHKGDILLRRCPGANAPSGPQGCSSVAALSSAQQRELFLSKSTVSS